MMRGAFEIIYAEDIRCELLVVIFHQKVRRGNHHRNRVDIKAIQVGRVVCGNSEKESAAATARVKESLVIGKRLASKDILHHTTTCIVLPRNVTLALRHQRLINKAKDITVTSPDVNRNIYVKTL